MAPRRQHCWIGVAALLRDAGGKPYDNYDTCCSKTTATLGKSQPAYPCTRPPEACPRRRRAPAGGALSNAGDMGDEWAPFAALAATSYNHLPRAAHNTTVNTTDRRTRSAQHNRSEVGARSAEAGVGPEFCERCERGDGRLRPSPQNAPPAQRGPRRAKDNGWRGRQLRSTKPPCG